MDREIVGIAVVDQQGRQSTETSDLFSPETLTDTAYRTLEHEIVTLRIPPGSVVSEAILSKRLGVGRTPIREALQRLARDWLVVIMPRRGVVVSEIDPVKQLRLLEVRRVLERLLVQSAARRGSPSQRQRFREVAFGMERSAAEADNVAFMEFDQEFNLLLIEAAGNEFAAAPMGLMNGLSRRFWFFHYKRNADLPRAARLHAAVAIAIAGSDQEAAVRASDELLDYIQEFARLTFE